MAENYFVKCNCGQSIRVELFEAGTSRRCSKCSSDVVVPNTTTLKESAGDKYPLLRPIEKIRRSLAAGEPPFHGWCHTCNDAEANHEVIIRLESLIERIVADDNGIRPTLSGVELYVGAADEHWETTRFPLLLCSRCYREFQKVDSRKKLMQVVKIITLVVPLLLFAYCIYLNAEAIAALSGLLTMVAFAACVVSGRKTNAFAPFVNRWLSNIRWLPEAIASEQEYKLIIEESRPYMKRTSESD